MSSLVFTLQPVVRANDASAGTATAFPSNLRLTRYLVSIHVTMSLRWVLTSTMQNVVRLSCGILTSGVPVLLALAAGSTLTMTTRPWTPRSWSPSGQCSVACGRVVTFTAASRSCRTPCRVPLPSQTLRQTRRTRTRLTPLLSCPFPLSRIHRLARTSRVPRCLRGRRPRGPCRPTWRCACTQSSSTSRFATTRLRQSTL
mmetsp:Transcript_7772/g.24933  ORF Transcript_7772/g.24933 Transcript_7772/m.24933 type:complete len:200 (+) Transcript_7772:322-921(+)